MHACWFRGCTSGDCSAPTGELDEFLGHEGQTVGSKEGIGRLMLQQLNKKKKAKIQKPPKSKKPSKSKEPKSGQESEI